MIRVACSDNYRPEREYAVKALFGLLIDENIEVDFGGRREDYEVSLGAGKRLLFPDLFFNSIEGFVASQEIPRAEQVAFPCNPFLIEQNLPVFYGTGEIRRKADEIRIDIDVFATCFFMLTRWEEVRNGKRDRHARFPGSESLSFKAGFLDRPIVEEYAAMVRNAASTLVASRKWRNREFQLMPTHDIDQIDYFGKGRTLAGRLMRGRLADRFTHLRDYLSGRNPWWTFPWLMEQSERHGLVSTFFFLHSNESKHDHSYDMESARVQRLLLEIRQRGHHIGLHLSYASCQNLDLILEEKAYLERVIDTRVRMSRQHFLRFDPAATWHLLDEAGIAEDYTVGYADAEGFRCGTGESFRAFDLIGRRTLDLVEMPLVVMDGTLLNYRGYGKDRASEACRNLIAKCMLYRTKCSILFHNSSFTDSKWAGWDRLYEEILSYPFARKPKEESCTERH